MIIISICPTNDLWNRLHVAAVAASTTASSSRPKTIIIIAHRYAEVPQIERGRRSHRLELDPVGAAAKAAAEDFRDRCHHIARPRTLTRGTLKRRWQEVRHFVDGGFINCCFEALNSNAFGQSLKLIYAILYQFMF